MHRPNKVLGEQQQGVAITGRGQSANPLGCPFHPKGLLLLGGTAYYFLLID